MNVGTKERVHWVALFSLLVSIGFLASAFLGSIYLLLFPALAGSILSALLYWAIRESIPMIMTLSLTTILCVLAYLFVF